MAKTEPEYIVSAEGFEPSPTEIEWHLKPPP